LLGWTLSCGSRWYDIESEQTAMRDTIPVLATDPVVPAAAQVARWWGYVTTGQWSRVFVEPPFVPPPHARDPRENSRTGQTVDNSSLHRPWNYWMMSQQVGSPSYLLFASGISLAIFLLFFVVADVAGWEIAFFRTLGVNALIGYFLHSIVDDAVKDFMPSDISGFGMWIGFSIYFLLCWLMLWSLEKKSIFLKL
jgi:hypothetical protein